MEITPARRRQVWLHQQTGDLRYFPEHILKVDLSAILNVKLNFRHYPHSHLPPPHPWLTNY